MRQRIGEVAVDWVKSFSGVEMDEFDEVGQLIQRMVCAIVDTPKAVTVEPVPDKGGTLYRVQVAEREVGQVIGKSGRTARSLRTILAAIGMKLKRRMTLDIVE